MKVAIIPARGGSKRIPRKNIIPFAGKPMIAHSILAARTSDLFDRIIVSTDDEEIASVAQKFGAEVPFRRPPELADDITGTAPVVTHAISAASLAPNDYVCCIYATPLVQPQDLRVGAEILQQGGWKLALSVTTFDYPIYRALTQATGGGVEMIYPEHRMTRSQDLPEAFHDAGQFYWAQASAWQENDNFFGPDSKPIHLPRWRTQDIDTMDDLKRAEVIFQLIQS